MTLQEKRQALRERFKGQDEHDPHYAKDANKLSGRPVAFIQDDEIVVLKEDVQPIMDGLKKFLSLVAGDNGWENRAKSEPTTAGAIRAAGRTVDLGAPEELRVPQQQWNGLMYALGEIGIQVVLSDGA